MKRKLVIRDVEPGVAGALQSMELFLMQSSLDVQHRELIALRASFINGCSQCLQLHAVRARQSGWTEQRIRQVACWKDASIFNREERILLALTDHLSLKPSSTLPGKLYNAALSAFGEAYLSCVVLAIASINAWNRLAVVFEI